MIFFYGDGTIKVPLYQKGLHMKKVFLLLFSLVFLLASCDASFAGGGVDFGIKKLVGAQNFGSGSGSGVSITPIAFLTVGKNADVNLIQINPDANKSVEKIASLIEHTPELIEKIKNTFSE